jgi:hypothetical protein
MDIMLMAITGASLAMALAMGALLAKLLRDERLRSDARVAALIEMSNDPPARPVTPRVTSISPTGEVQLSSGAPVSRPHSERVRPPHVAGSDAPAGSLFEEPERSSPWLPRLAAAAAFVTVVGALGYVLLPTRAGGDVSAVVRPAAEPAAAPATAPLELLALRHATDRGTLTVSGLVQNPRSAGTRTGVVATVFAFSTDGALLASGRAPLDFTTLAPGDESPFVISVPVSGPLARYRVGFRAGDGAVIAHIDRRGLGEAVARK